MQIRRKNSPGNQIAGYLNTTMSIAYLCCGFYILVSSNSGKLIPAEFRLPVSVLLIVYGFFRIYRAYKQLA